MEHDIKTTLISIPLPLQDCDTKHQSRVFFTKKEGKEFDNILLEGNYNVVGETTTVDKPKAKKVLKWIKENFGEHVQFDKVDKKHPYLPFKKDIFYGLTEGMDSVFDEEQVPWAESAFKMDKELFSEHRFVFQRCILAVCGKEFPDSLFNDMFSVMELNVGFHGEKKTYLVFFKEDTPETEPPFGWKQA